MHGHSRHRRDMLHSYICDRVGMVLPAKAREYVFTGVGSCVCVCLSVTMITKKIVDGFVPNFKGRFLGGKVRPSSCFVTIGRRMWK